MTDAENLASLEAAIASGAKRVKYQDKETEFHSMDDLIRARDLLITKLQGGKVTISANRPAYSGGFES